MENPTHPILITIISRSSHPHHDSTEEVYVYNQKTPIEAVEELPFDPFWDHLFNIFYTNTSWTITGTRKPSERCYLWNTSVPNHRVYIIYDI